MLTKPFVTVMILLLLLAYLGALAVSTAHLSQLYALFNAELPYWVSIGLAVALEAVAFLFSIISTSLGRRAGPWAAWASTSALLLVWGGNGYAMRLAAPTQPLAVVLAASCFVPVCTLFAGKVLGGLFGLLDELNGEKVEVTRHRVSAPITSAALTRPELGGPVVVRNLIDIDRSALQQGGERRSPTPVEVTLPVGPQADDRTATATRREPDTAPARLAQDLSAPSVDTPSQPLARLDAAPLDVPSLDHPASVPESGHAPSHSVPESSQSAAVRASHQPKKILDVAGVGELSDQAIQRVGLSREALSNLAQLVQLGQPPTTRARLLSAEQAVLTWAYVTAGTNQDANVTVSKTALAAELGLDNKEWVVRDVAKSVKTILTAFGKSSVVNPGSAKTPHVQVAGQQGNRPEAGPGGDSSLPSSKLPMSTSPSGSEEP
ncbi:hypothetical protein [Deinococcus sonorensis]|uniref:Uncharacterized protein n=2 Tax=Deinococcus sonorensis TaxID=309891 RepID=A0AAU7UFZ1_9DEIO